MLELRAGAVAKLHLYREVRDFPILKGSHNPCRRFTVSRLVDLATIVTAGRAPQLLAAAVSRLFDLNRLESGRLDCVGVEPR